MNETTKRLLDGLLKLKEVEPKLTSVNAEFDILDNLLSNGQAGYTLTLNFSGYVSLYTQTPKGGFRFTAFPTEINFYINEVHREDFNSIDWNAINGAMGYVVFQPENEPDFSQTIQNIKSNVNITDKTLTLGNKTPYYVESRKACTCDKDQVLNQGCSCGGI